jgi:hypothetical protein
MECGRAIDTRDSSMHLVAQCENEGSLAREVVLALFGTTVIMQQLRIQLSGSHAQRVNAGLCALAACTFSSGDLLRRATTLAWRHCYWPITGLGCTHELIPPRLSVIITHL